MAIAQGIECDEEMLETLRLVISKVSPRELEVYAASSVAFAKGGFRKSSVALIRGRIQSMLASKEPVDDHLRKIIREQIRRSLEAGGGNVAIQKQLEKALSDLELLKGADTRLQKEIDVRAGLERENARAKEALNAALKERGQYRQELEKVQAELDRIKRDSARALDAEMQVRLSKEMARFFKEIKTRPARSGESPASSVIDLISKAKDSELAEWKSAALRMHEAKVFDDEEHESIAAEIRRRYTELHMQGFERKYRKDGELSDSRELFLSALSGEIPAILLIDAHNTLFAIQSRYRLPNDHRYPDAKARQWLVNDVVQLLENAPNMRAYIVFDGNERTDTAASSNVQVIYSGGEGEHRADKVLIDEAHYLRDAGAENLFIITNDGELAGGALRYGAVNLAPTDLHSAF